MYAPNVMLAVKYTSLTHVFRAHKIPGKLQDWYLDLYAWAAFRRKFLELSTPQMIYVMSVLKFVIPKSMSIARGINILVLGLAAAGLYKTGRFIGRKLRQRPGVINDV